MSQSPNTAYQAVAEALCVPVSGAHLEQALTHPSFANEHRDIPDNQRLEFLGDAILQFCASELLFRRCPNASEGELTRRRAQVVNTEALAEFARVHGVGGALRVGRGAAAHGIRESANVLADAVEALIAAAYLDGGLKAARDSCARLIEAGLEYAETDGRDAKTLLQERVQARGLGAPSYELLDSGGPAHQRWFEVGVRVDGCLLASGRGRSKRQAEQAAAAEALAAQAQAEEGAQPASAERTSD